MRITSSPLCIRRSSFTLMEGLFAFVVLAILIAFLLPWYRDKRRKQGRMACMNNLRQIVLAVHQYATEHEGPFPESGVASVESNARLLGKFLGDAGPVFKCPTDHQKRLTNSISLITDANISYCYVRGLDTNAPSSLPLWFERGVGVASPARLIDFEGKAWLPDQAHGKSGGNIAFIDGRVELRPVFPAVSPPPATNEVLIPR